MGSDLGTILINGSMAFSLGIKAILVLGGVFGVYVTGRGLLDLFVAMSQDTRFSNQQTSYAGGLIRLLVGGAFCVMASLLWAAAETFTGGGDQTAALFDYGSAASNGYCDQVRVATTYLVMFVGASAFFRCLYIIHAKQSGGSVHMTGSPFGYLMFGTLAFFISDVSAILSRTFGLPVGLDNLCKVLM